MSSDPNPPQHGLEWKYELFEVTPSWTVEPDMAVAKAIALRHLHLTSSSYGIIFFSAGAFNKLFLLQPLNDAGGALESFIMRVGLPVDPYFKTTSEVATLQFVKNTSIPVPQIIAFDSSADNELGFEWILMTKIPGVPLQSLWESPDLVSFNFPLMGNLYPSSRPEIERVAWLKDLSSKSRFVPLSDDPEFAIGPLTTIPFFYGDRIRLQNSRCAFETSSSYLTSLLHLHISSTMNRKIAASTDDEYDEDDISEFEDIIAAYESLLSVLPIFFPSDASDAETFSLFHDDISTNNILVDPTTYRITGIVDWEGSGIEVCNFLSELLEVAPNWDSIRERLRRSSPWVVGGSRAANANRRAVRLCTESLALRPGQHTDSAKLTDPDLYKELETPERANGINGLRVQIFFTTKDIYSVYILDVLSILCRLKLKTQEGKLGKGLNEFMNKVIVEKGKNKEELVVVDPKLGIKVISDIDTLELFRGIRSQLTALLNGLDPKDLATMSLGLSHSLSRFKLKFSPDKVYTMVVQAIALLDDLDKEINIYTMRVKEWYGWHFSKMSKILSENLAYAKRSQASGQMPLLPTFAVILPEELEATIKAAAEISMGTEVSESDLAHIHALCDQVISISEYRAQRSEYLRNRMIAIALNLTALVGELVGARLISHAGSLAQKRRSFAHSRRNTTPKYGLIYHAFLVDQAPPKLKGKQQKTALSVRVDALTDADEKSTPSAPTIGLENPAKLEARLRSLEAESDATGLTDAVGLRRAKRRAEKEKAATAQEDKPDAAAVDGEADAMEVDEGGKVDEKKRKRRKSEVTSSAAVDDGAVAAMEGVETEAEHKARKLAEKAEKAAAIKTEGGESSSKKKKKRLKSEK
ncbi:hypothetical protein F5888DRAFT_1800325 [Russula emetica]|nr:hypothetical protein F5888DRAFT_1800325 [Russula emetica]